MNTNRLTLNRTGNLRKAMTSFCEGHEQGDSRSSRAGMDFGIPRMILPPSLQVISFGFVLASFITVMVLTPSTSAQELEPCSVSAWQSIEGELPVVSGESNEIQLRLSGACDSGASESGSERDIVLVIDRSSSMSRDLKLPLAKKAVETFVQLADPATTRMSIVAFSDTAEVVQGLTNDKEALFTAILEIQWNPGTNLVDSLDLARSLLTEQPANREAQKIIVFLTDGHHSVREPTRDRVDPVISKSHAEGITIYTIGLGSLPTDIDEPLLKKMAGDPSRYFYCPSPEQLEEIYTDLAGLTAALPWLRAIEIEAKIPAEVHYVLNSAEPPARWDPGSIGHCNGNYPIYALPHWSLSIGGLYSRRI